MEGLELAAARMKELAEDLSFRAGGGLPPSTLRMPSASRYERSTTPSQASVGAGRAYEPPPVPQPPAPVAQPPPPPAPQPTPPQHPQHAPPPGDDGAMSRKIQQVVAFYQNTIQDFTNLLDSNQKVIEELRGNYAKLQEENATLKQQLEGGEGGGNSTVVSAANTSRATDASASMQELSTQLKEEKRSRLYTEEQSISIVGKQEEIINRLEAKLRSAEEQNQRLEETIRHWEGGARPARAPGTPRNSRITFSASSTSKGTAAPAVDISHLSAQLSAPPPPQVEAAAEVAQPAMGDPRGAQAASQVSQVQPASTLNTLASNTFYYGKHRSLTGPAGGSPGRGEPALAGVAAPPQPQQQAYHAHQVEDRMARSGSAASDKSHKMFNYNNTVPSMGVRYGGGADTHDHAHAHAHAHAYANPPQHAHEPPPHLLNHMTPGREGARMVKRASPTRSYSMPAQGAAMQRAAVGQAPSSSAAAAGNVHKRSPPRSALRQTTTLGRRPGESPERAHVTSFSEETGYMAQHRANGWMPSPEQPPTRHTLRSYSSSASGSVRATSPTSVAVSSGGTTLSSAPAMAGHAALRLAQNGGGSGLAQRAAAQMPAQQRGGGGAAAAQPYGGDDIVSSFLRDMNQELKSLNESEASRAAVLDTVFTPRTQAKHGAQRHASPAAARASAVGNAGRYGMAGVQGQYR